MENTLIGYRASTHALFISQIGDLFFLTEKRSDDSFLPRGANLLLDSTVVLNGTPYTIDSNDSANNGYSLPSNFPETVTGYTKKTETDGAVYYQVTATTTRALINGEVVGTRAGANLKTVLFGNDWRIIEVKTTSPDAYFVRGRNVLLKSDVTMTLEVSQSLLTGPDTTYSGMAVPADFVTPIGYARKTEPDGAVYFEKIVGSSTGTPEVITGDTTTKNKAVGKQDATSQDGWFKRNWMYVVGGVVLAGGIGWGIYAYVTAK